MTGFGIVRTLILAFGVLMVLGGFAAIAIGGASGAAGIWNVVIGLVLVAAVLLERSRYRADGADGSDDAPGRAGGEPSGTALDPRFRPTDERFEDPTTRQRMRVWLDPRSGERRYVPED